MKRVEVDARGLECPRPLIELKKALKTAGIEECRLWLDNETACQNVMIFLHENGYSFSTEKNDQGMQLIIRVATKMKPIQNANAVNDIVYVISSDEMGRGDRDLGKILLQAMINSLPELEFPPTQIIFYNSGIKLLEKREAATAGILSSLLRLQEQAGTKIYACGTCVDYYDVQVVDGVKITNMLSILEKVQGAEKVIHL